LIVEVVSFHDGSLGIRQFPQALAKMDPSLIKEATISRVRAALSFLVESVKNLDS
jgi:hypothetical protein